MCDSKDKDQSRVPDFTKEGFRGKTVSFKQTQNDSMLSVQSFHQQLADQGITALDLSACASASLNNGEICFNFPVVGKICFNSPIPLPPIGASLKVCGEVCFKWGVIPEGVKVTLYLDDNPVWNGTVWGSC